MKKHCMVLLMILFAMLCSTEAVFAGEENDIMKNKNQDILFVGKVSHVERDYIVLKVTDYINVRPDAASIGKREEDHRYVLTKNTGLSYRWSYHNKKQIEEGDCVTASLKKGKNQWEVANGLYETDCDDYRVLSFQPISGKLNFDKTVMKYFINSDGKAGKFTKSKDETKFYYKGYKIYDARWNMKKYLTIEEIRNAEKLKAMDYEGSERERKKPKKSDGGKRTVLFIADILIITFLVAMMHKKGKNKK